MSNDENKFVRNKIIRGFLVVALMLWILESLVDEAMSWLDKSSNEISFTLNMNHSTFMHLSIALYLIVSILIFILSAYIFYRFTKKVLNEESKKRVYEQNMIFAAIAHDLKTPMTSIQGFSKALMDKKIPNEDLQSTYKLIHEKTKYTNELLNTMFDYSKFGMKNYEFKKEEVDLTVLVRNLVAEHFGDFEVRNIYVEVQIPDDSITITGDKKELRRAIENVLVNSFTHNKEGSKVQVSVYAEHGSTFISIADNGKEIPEDLDVFKPLVTSNENRTGGNGTGMGLMIAKRIIERHGGSIEIKKSPGEYTKEFLLKI